jgi:hypothetical protein
LLQDRGVKMSCEGKIYRTQFTINSIEKYESVLEEVDSLALSNGYRVLERLTCWKSSHPNIHGILKNPKSIKNLIQITMLVIDESYSLINTCNVFCKKGVILEPVGKYKIIRASNDEIKLKKIEKSMNIMEEVING